MFGYKYKCNNDGERLYKQGMELYNSSKYSDAYYNFKQVKYFSDLYELSLLKAFQSAEKLADKKTAYIKLKELSKYSKDENILPYVLYNEVNYGLELKQITNSAAYKKYKYIYDNFNGNDFAIASAFKMAQLVELTDKSFAKIKYIEYLKYAPNGKFSSYALDFLSKTDAYISKEEWEVIANAYLANQKYEKALNAYKNTYFSRNWHNIAKCYKGLGVISAEKDVLVKGFNLKVSDVDEKSISKAIDRYIAILKTDKLSGLQNLYVNYSQSYIIPTVTYKLAETSSSIRAIKLYENVVDEYPNSIWASNSLWEVFWYNYGLKRYQTCEMLARKHISNYYDTQDAPRVMYWYAKVLLKEKRNLQARDTLYKVINEYPLSYYAFLSARQLKISKAKQMIVKKPIPKYSIDSLNKFLFKEQHLSKLASYNDFETIDDLKIDNEYIKSWVAYKKENYTKSINLAKNEFNKKIGIVDSDDILINEEVKVKVLFSDYELKLMYPIVYQDFINEHALKFKRSPYLFLSLVREESHFDKSARSSVGAVGLSQLMKPTADFIEKESVSQEKLLNPDDNIKMGIKYFDYLVKYFDGDEFLAILSYNAGPGNIKKWLNNPNISSNEIDVFVENVPFLETKNYIKKILSSYWIYLNIYSPKNIK